MDPNFPPGLAISPSVRSAPYSQFVTQLPRSPLDETAFGSPAQHAAIAKYGIAGRVWEAAYAMAFYIQDLPNVDFDPPFDLSLQRPSTVLELGSGSGMVGSRIAWKLPDPGQDLLIVTDLPEVCPLLKANLCSSGDAANGVLVRQLTWGNSEHAAKIASEFFTGVSRHPRFLTHVICSDLVYFPHLFAPLLRTLIHVTSPPFVPHPDSGMLQHKLLVLISYRVRSLVKEAPFWSAFGLWFTFEPVLMRPTHSDNEPLTTSWTRASWRDGPTFIFAAQRRPSSFTWRVPLVDDELMGGVGAWGTDSRKGDDTFETLLLMTMASTMTNGDY